MARSVASGLKKARASAALFGVCRRHLAVGLTGVALCHDIFITRTATRARRRLGLAGLAAMLAAHVGLAFKIVFTGHAGSMHWPGNGSQSAGGLFEL
jgi:hypothetical protein